MAAANFSSAQQKCSSPKSTTKNILALNKNTDLRKHNEGAEMYSNSQTNIVATISATSLELKDDKQIGLDGTLPDKLVFELIQKSFLLSDR